MKGIIMSNRKAKFKAFVKNHSLTLVSVTSLAAGALAFYQVQKYKMERTVANFDGVPEELWDEMFAVAKKMDDAVADAKANKA